MSWAPGFHADFFDPDKRTDLMIEAPIDQVSPAVVEHADLLPVVAETPRLMTDAWGRPEGEEQPPVWIFQLRDHPWTQVAAWHSCHALVLAQQLSTVLATRCFAIDVTDDAYGTEGLFDRGEVAELAIRATPYDIGIILPCLGLPAPPPVDEDKLYEEGAFHFQSRLRDVSKAAQSLPKLIGFSPHVAWPKVDGTLGLCDLEASDVVRLDVIYSR